MGARSVAGPSRASLALGLTRVLMITPCPNATGKWGSRLLRPVYAVLQPIHQRLPGGFDDVLGDAYGAPHPLAVCGVYEDAGRGGGGAVLVEDTDLVVGEVDLFQFWIVRPDGFSQSAIEGVDGAVALGGGDDPVPAHGELDGRLRRRLPAGA